MKKLMVLALIALGVGSFAGCSHCRSLFSGGLFNRGDRCQEYPADDCAPGYPRATMMVPSSPQMLPGPFEIAPTN
jgi:hypothetical protein